MKIYTLAEYVDRLEKMLTSKTDPCMHCPVLPKFCAVNPYKTQYRAKDALKAWDANCKTCQEFIGLDFIDSESESHSYYERYRFCPCTRHLDSGEAIIEAWRAIHKFRANQQRKKEKQG